MSDPEQPADAAPRPPRTWVVVPVESTFGVVPSGAVTAAGMPVVRQALLATVLDADGALPPGSMCILADHALGHALSDRIGEEQRMVTSHMHLEVTRPTISGTTAIHGSAEELHVAGSSGFARGRIVDDADQLVAWVSARFALIDALGGLGGNVAPDDAAPASAGAPQRGAGPGAPIDRLLRTSVRPSDGALHVVYVATPELSNERYGLHGGVGALMAERAMSLALRGEEPGDRFALAELRVAFLRPLPASGQEVHVRADVVMRGRTTASTSARIVRPDGKVAVQADAIHVRA